MRSLHLNICYFGTFRSCNNFTCICSFMISKVWKFEQYKQDLLAITHLSMAYQRAWKEKDFQESLVKGEDPERQDIEQQNSSHQALQGEFLNQNQLQVRPSALKRSIQTSGFFPRLTLKPVSPRLFPSTESKSKAALSSSTIHQAANLVKRSTW